MTAAAPHSGTPCVHKPNAKEVEARLAQAGRVLLALPHAGCFPAGFRTLWPGTAGAPGQAWVPAPGEITAMDEAYRWAGLIDDVDERRLVLMRSLVRPCGGHVWSWRRLSRLTGLHRDTLMTVWGRGIDRIVRGLAPRDRAVWTGWGGLKPAPEAGFGLHLRAAGGLAAHLPRKSGIPAPF
jgi:hypothetical protein